MVKITDLVGVRILHLHTKQLKEIDHELRTLFAEERIELFEEPFARTWDDESRLFMRECGFVIEDSPSMYTSVHYVVSSASRSPITAEIQVRTLMEEVWGEVDHSIRYPDKTPSLACQEQLKVLARATSTATRLVDAIFTTMENDEKTSDKPDIALPSPPAKGKTAKKKIKVKRKRGKRN